MPQKQLALQSRKAMFSLKRTSQSMRLNHKTILSVFDLYVSSIANYTYEVWGFHTAPDFRKGLLRFWQRILNVKLLPIAMVYLELCFPLIKQSKNSQILVQTYAY